MKIQIKNITGEYAIGECGIVDLDLYENQEHSVENKSYNNFDKREMFWTIYDQIIIPTREKMGTDTDHSLRLLFIEDDDDKLTLHFNIDDYDETYCEVLDVDDKLLDDVIKNLYDDLSETLTNLPDDEPMKKSIMWDKSREVSIPVDYIERIKKDVFYSSWDIEIME